MNRATMILTAALAAAAISPAMAQMAPKSTLPQVRGSLDAVTVVPSTRAAGSQPAAQPAMPAGHPSLEGTASAGAAHASMAGPKSGALRVVVSQGTKGGPAIGKEPVSVMLMSSGEVLKRFDLVLDEKGMAELHDLPLDKPFQPILTVTHGGAEQQMAGPPMHKYQPAVQMEMKVYEATAEKPAWTLGIRDIVAQPVDLGEKGIGLKFVEMLGGFNPSDKAWTGEVTDKGERRTMTIPLPENIGDLLLGAGLAEAGAKLEDHALVRGKSMMPGSTEYDFGYVIAPEQGQVTATFTAPADTTLFALYLPGSAKIERMSGLEAGKASGEQGSQAKQLLKARNVKAGQRVSVTVSHLVMPAPATMAAPLPQTSDLHLPVPAVPGKKPETKP